MVEHQSSPMTLDLCESSKSRGCESYYHGLLHTILQYGVFIAVFIHQLIHLQCLSLDVPFIQLRHDSSFAGLGPAQTGQNEPGRISDTRHGTDVTAWILHRQYWLDPFLQEVIITNASTQGTSANLRDLGVEY